MDCDSDSATLQITADGNTLLQQTKLTPWTYENNTVYSATLKSPASEVQVGNTQDAGGLLDFYQVTIDIPGKDTIHLVPYNFGTYLYQFDEKQPTMTIAADGSVTDSQMVTGDYTYSLYVQPIAQLAQQYGVGFMITEVSVGSDVDAKYAYKRQEDLLSPLQTHQIAWAADSFRDIIKPSRKNINVENYSGTPWYYESEIVKNYRKFGN